MKVIVVTKQTDGDVYVQGVYRNCTEETIKEVFSEQMGESEIDEYEFHDMDTSTKPQV